MKKSLQKALNSNSYQWWRDHRNLIFIGLFLSVFAVYIRTPLDKEIKIKDTCAKLNSSYQITGDTAVKKLNLKEKNNFNNRELANYYCERYLGIR